VHELVLDIQLTDDSCLPGVALVPRCGGPTYPDPHLAARVPTEHGPVLDQCDLQSVSSSGNGRADACEPTSGDNDVGGQILVMHHHSLVSRPSCQRSKE